MTQLFKTKTGWLRIIAFLEGVSLIALVFIAVPIKYMAGNPAMVKTLGPIHGAIFLLFLINALSVGIEHNWKLNTWFKVVLACFIPFGTFYIDSKILSKLQPVA
jgi:integral membrane protein